MRSWLALLLLTGCQEYSLHKPPVVPPAKPPGAQQGEHGAPPNWQDCPGGYLGLYSNLTVDHPDVEPDPEAPPPEDPLALDWWDTVAFERFDPYLDFGGNWWPVDEGLQADPRYFAVRWLAWIRAWDHTEVRLAFGSSDDAWVLVDGEPVVAHPGVGPFEPEVVSFPLRAGQFPLEVRYAHRAGPDSGLRVRVLSGNVSICYPSYSPKQGARGPALQE